MQLIVPFDRDGQKGWADRQSGRAERQVAFPPGLGSARCPIFSLQPSGRGGLQVARSGSFSNGSKPKRDFCDLVDRPGHVVSCFLVPFYPGLPHRFPSPSHVAPARRLCWAISETREPKEGARKKKKKKYGRNGFRGHF
jgi:hypothetical protein